MCFNSLITKSHFDLCRFLVDNSITLDFPWPHTINVAKFSKVAGIENLESLKKSGLYVPGYYRIWGLGQPNDLCYIGQSKHLGLRVKYHAKGNNKSTYSFCSNLGNKVKVDLFILPKNKDILNGLTQKEFLCTLEQYLIFKYRPKLNKLFIARPGIIWNREVITKHRYKVGKKVYIYIKSKKNENNLDYIYVCDSASYASKILGRERSWIKNNIIRNKGWYKDSLYFSLVPLKELKIRNIKYKITRNLKDINEIKLYVEELLKDVLSRKGIMVKVTNVIKNEIKIYRSKREAARNIKVDPSSIYSRNKLLRGIYKIEILD